jgi:eukaryotic-like serine/threonine-protein kinase
MSQQPEPKIAVSPSVTDLTGRIGKYEIRRILGRGAMGVVYLAHDAALERDVAIKVMLAHFLDDPDLKKRFEREARAVARMMHPNVVTIFELGYHVDGSPYIAMELLHGLDLQKTIRHRAAMPLERKVSVILEVLAGLGHAHEAGIVHRDIKPANIFIMTDGAVKIMDFGVARLTAASVTGAGIVGTANYMSPEQVRGALVDGRSDLFSVGCVLYELIAGRALFRGENVMAIFYKITHGAPEFEAFPVDDASRGLLPILRKALAKRADERYQTAYEFGVDLADYLGTRAPSPSAKRVLDKLGELSPPTKGPARTDVADPTLVMAEDVEPPSLASARSAGATEPLPERGMTPRASRDSPRGSPLVRADAAASGASTRGMPMPLAERPAPGTIGFRASTSRPAPGPRPSPVGLVLLAGLVAAATGGGWFVYRQSTGQRQEEVKVYEPPRSPTSPATPPLSPSTPPPTSPAARAAAAALDSGNYDEAIRQAETALRESPGSEEARNLLDKALTGQKARRHFAAAESALGRGDFDEATRQAEAGRMTAPWDGRARELGARIDAARVKAQQEATRHSEQQQRDARINTMLSKADAALQNQDYPGAITTYQQVIEMDPMNARALNGKSVSVQAQALALERTKTTSSVAPAKSFSSGKTIAQSPETSESSTPTGFAAGSVAVNPASQPAALPGKVLFDVEPKQVKTGEKYTVSIFLLNEGSAPIEIRGLAVTTTINGLNSSGAVQSQVKDVAPHDKALLISVPGHWKDETATWSMDVIVRTTRGETYRNQVTWK